MVIEGGLRRCVDDTVFKKLAEIGLVVGKIADKVGREERECRFVA